MMFSKKIIEFLEECKTVSVGTVTPEGKPHVTAVWHIFEKDDIIFNAEKRAVKVKNLLRNPNITMLFDLYDERWVILDGTAEMIYDQPSIKDHLDRLFIKYHGTTDNDYTREVYAQMPERLSIRVKVSNVISFGVD